MSSDTSSDIPLDIPLADPLDVPLSDLSDTSRRYRPGPARDRVRVRRTAPGLGRRPARGHPLARVARLLVTGALAGTLGCSGAEGADGTPGPGAASATAPASAGRLTGDRDAQGHRYREVPRQQAPEVELVVRHGGQDGWDLLLTLHRFRFSPARHAGHTAVAGRGRAELSLDGRRLAVLHTAHYHLPARRLSRGTHQLTACLLADDGTVWAVDGKPVQNTADLTTSGREVSAPR